MAEETADPTTIDLNYLKSADFREVACDGILGGPTPQGKLWLAFYTERFPLPRKVRHGIERTNDDRWQFRGNDDGSPLEGLTGIVRNVEFGVYLSIETAEQLHQWLGTKIEELKEGSNP